MTADEAVQNAATEKVSVLDEAVEWLLQTLVPGPMPATEIQELADMEGISEKTLRRARERLGIKPTKSGYQGAWM